MKKLFFVGLVFSFLAGFGCSKSEVETAGLDLKPSATTSPTNANKSENKNTPENSSEPNNENESNEDETNSIIGTWKHISTAKTADGERQPLKVANIQWTFKSDGTGSYKQTVKGIERAGGTNAFNWKLNEKEIEITPISRGKSVTYTIIEQSENEMTWRNNVLGDYYFVEKQ